MTKYVTTILLFSTLFISELHTFWANNTEVQNWIIAVKRPMLIQWNVKMLSNQVNTIVYFLAWLFYVKNRVNFTTVKCFLVLAILDTLVYFYNYKMYGFAPMYFWAVAIWVLIYKGKAISVFLKATRNYLSKKLHLVK